jgi:hypothetical protein
MSTLFAVVASIIALTVAIVSLYRASNSAGSSSNFVFDRDLIPTQDDVYTIGNPSYRVKELYVGSGTVFIGPNGELGNDNNGILYANNGFSAPTFVVGAGVPQTGIINEGVAFGWNSVTNFLLYDQIQNNGSVSGSVNLVPYVIAPQRYFDPVPAFNKNFVLTAFDFNAYPNATSIRSDISVINVWGSSTFNSGSYSLQSYTSGFCTILAQYNRDIASMTSNTLLYPTVDSTDPDQNCAATGVPIWQSVSCSLPPWIELSPPGTNPVMPFANCMNFVVQEDLKNPTNFTAYVNIETQILS